MIGRKVVWTQGKKKLIGEIINLHGRNGVVEAKFRKGLPGWAIGTTVELVGKARQETEAKSESGA